MANRPGWHDDYWNRMDKETARRIRTTCPRCGSDRTYFNKQLGIWRCGRCEHSFVVKGLDDRVPWWRRFFSLGKKKKRW